MQTIQRKISELNPAPYNPRTISEQELNKLIVSIKEFGFVEPVVINKDDTIIGGHKRIEAVTKMGWTEVPCVVVDLPKEREMALNLALNKISGEWEFGKLYEVLTELDDDLLLLTGFDKAEVDKIKGILDSADDDISLEDDFDETLKNSEFRILIPPESDNVSHIRDMVKEIKDKYNEVIVREST